MTVSPRRAHPTGALDLAVLGLLADSPRHGYQLRALLAEILGPARSYSYGSIYPALQRLERSGWIAADAQRPASDEPAPDRPASGDPASDRPASDRPASDAVPGPAPRRNRVTYRLTPAGGRQLADLLTDVGPASVTDEAFGVRLALFPHTGVDARLAILQGRRDHLQRQREGLLASVAGATDPDGDTAALHRLTIAAHDRELLWLRGLIAREQHRAASDNGSPPTALTLDTPSGTPAGTPSDRPTREAHP